MEPEEIVTRYRALVRAGYIPKEIENELNYRRTYLTRLNESYKKTHTECHLCYRVIPRPRLFCGFVCYRGMIDDGLSWDESQVFYKTLDKNQDRMVSLRHEPRTQPNHLSRIHQPLPNRRGEWPQARHHARPRSEVPRQSESHLANST